MIFYLIFILRCVGMLYKRKFNGFTKIVATLGPSTSSYEMIDRLLQNGVNVFRINFSHGFSFGAFRVNR